MSLTYVAATIDWTAGVMSKPYAASMPADGAVSQLLPALQNLSRLHRPAWLGALPGRPGPEPARSLPGYSSAACG
jgi:hypothetical protein